MKQRTAESDLNSWVYRRKKRKEREETEFKLGCVWGHCKRKSHVGCSTKSTESCKTHLGSKVPSFPNNSQWRSALDVSSTCNLGGLQRGAISAGARASKGIQLMHPSIRLSCQNPNHFHHCPRGDSHSLLNGMSVLLLSLQGEGPLPPQCAAGCEFKILLNRD